MNIIIKPAVKSLRERALEMLAVCGAVNPAETQILAVIAQLESVKAEAATKGSKGKAEKVYTTPFEEDIIKAVLKHSKSYADALNQDKIKELLVLKASLLADIKTAKDLKKKPSKDKEVQKLADKLPELENALFVCEKTIADQTAIAATKQSFEVIRLNEKALAELVALNAENWTVKITEKVDYFKPNAGKHGYKCSNQSDALSLVTDNFETVIHALFTNCLPLARQRIEAHAIITAEAEENAAIAKAEAEKQTAEADKGTQS